MCRKKIKWLFLLLVVLSVFNASAQNKKSEEAGDSIVKGGIVAGILITKQSDTLKCIVRFHFGYENSLDDLLFIVFKKDSHSIITVKPSEVKSIRTSYFQIGNVPVGGTERLMLLVAEGKITLYSYTEVGKRNILLDDPEFWSNGSQY